jgi:hypothetical protein
MLTQKQAPQVPQTPLRVCVEKLTEEEIRSIVAYIMAKSAGQGIVIHRSSPRLAEMIFLVDLMNPRTRDKLSLFLTQKVVPQKLSRIREGRGKLNRYNR